MKRIDKKLLAILLDSGDTLVDEATEIKNIRWATVRDELIPGAAEMVKGLHHRGYTLALVADGPVETFDNIFRQHNLSRYFAVRSISGIVGVSKPDPRMFITAFEELGIPEEDYGRVMMVGNHLSRDIKGTNALGLVSVWLRWSPRRSKVFQGKSAEFIIDTHKVPPFWREVLEKRLSRLQRKGDERVLRNAKMAARRRCLEQLKKLITYFQKSSTITDEDAREIVLNELNAAYEEWLDMDWDRIIS